MTKPVGVYDSGIGGLTVLEVLKQRFPQENWLYLQDAEHRPYGSRSQKEIISLGRQCLDTLQGAGIKACVVACHTSSALALSRLESDYTFPLVGMISPSVRALCMRPDTPVLWLATRASIISNTLMISARRAGFRGKVCPVICDGWVEQIEKGLSSITNEAMIRHTLAPYQQWIKQNSPQILYGCTHYPWLDGSLQSILGQHLHYIDPAKWVGDDLAEVLSSADAMTPVNSGKVVRLSSGRAIKVMG